VSSEACERAATLSALTQLLSNFTPQLISQLHGMYCGPFKKLIKKKQMNSDKKKVIKPNSLRKMKKKVVLQKLNMNPYQLQSIVYVKYMLIL
jgi:hypothetical protein